MEEEVSLLKLNTSLYIKKELKVSTKVFLCENNAMAELNQMRKAINLVGILHFLIRLCVDGIRMETYPKYLNVCIGRFKKF